MRERREEAEVVVQRRLSKTERALARASRGMPPGRAQAQLVALEEQVQVEVSEAGPRGRGELARRIVAVAVESWGRERQRVAVLSEATPSDSGRCQCKPTEQSCALYQVQERI